MEKDRISTKKVTLQSRAGKEKEMQYRTLKMLRFKLLSNAMNTAGKRTYHDKEEHILLAKVQANGFASSMEGKSNFSQKGFTVTTNQNNTQQGNDKKYC